MSQPPSGTSGPVEEIHWPSLIAAIAAITAVGIAIGLGLPLLSIIMEKRGISPTLIGLNSAMAGLASMAAAPLTTKFAHRYGVATTMLWAVLFAAVSGLGFYYITNFWLWFPLRVVFHGAITVLFVLSEFWINATAPPRRRGLVLGIYGTVLSLGFATGPLLFSILGSDGIIPFAVGAGVILTAAIPIYLARGESPVLDEKPELHFMRYVFLVPTATAAVFVFGAVELGRPLAVSDLRHTQRLYRIAGRTASDRHGNRQRHLPDSARHSLGSHEGPAQSSGADDHYWPAGRTLSAAADGKLDADGRRAVVLGRLRFRALYGGP